MDGSMSVLLFPLENLPRTLTGLRFVRISFYVLETITVISAAAVPFLNVGTFDRTVWVHARKSLQML